MVILPNPKPSSSPVQSIQTQMEYFKIVTKTTGLLSKEKGEGEKLQQRIKHFIQYFYPKSLLLGLRQTF